MDDGWFLVATRGSHRQFKHPTKPGRVTIADKPSDDLAPGTRLMSFQRVGVYCATSTGRERTETAVKLSKIGRSSLTGNGMNVSYKIFPFFYIKLNSRAISYDEL